VCEVECKKNLTTAHPPLLARRLCSGQRLAAPRIDRGSESMPLMFGLCTNDDDDGRLLSFSASSIMRYADRSRRAEVEASTARCTTAISMVACREASRDDEVA
jgi:hypothetical protein